VIKASSFIVTIPMMAVLLVEPLALAGGGQGNTRVKNSVDFGSFFSLVLKACQIDNDS